MATTRKVQRSTLSVQVGEGDELLIGGIENFNGLSSPLNKINIGSWEDLVIKTRPGRKKLGSCTFSLNLNPDDEVQRLLKGMQRSAALEGEDGEAVFVLTQSEGTIKKRTFTAMVSQFGESSSDDGIYKGDITLVVTSNAVRS